jgi:aryl-alcohol dehydrogenase-like predicted oxidoreductase
MALRFILSNPDVSVTIPGMRKVNHVASNMSAADGQPLSDDLLKELKKHRWDRLPTEWSQ